MAGTPRPRKKKGAPTAADELRREAEERFDKLSADAADAGSPLPEDVAAVVHELRVHQIELEMQNEELRHSQLELQASREKYVELFDLAPVGYLTLSAESSVRDANLSAARLLGVERQQLVKKPFTAFIFAPDQDVYYRHQRMLEQTGEPQTCELRLKRAGGDADAAGAPGHFWAHLEGQPQRKAGREAPSTWVTFTDVSARKQAEEELVRGAAHLHEQLHDTLKAMGAIIGLRDQYTAAHEHRVTALCAAIAAELGLDDEAREALAFAGEVHDIGKIGVPAEILSKPGMLTDVEFALIKQHPEAGRDLLGAIHFRQPVAEIVAQHHERMDGSGYPRGLKGAQILLEARIVAIADVVEAMASHRPYRAALGLDAALAEARAGAGTRYDADVVAACEHVFAQGFAFTEP